MESLDLETIIGIVLLAALAVVYVVPTILAIRWRHRRWYLLAVLNITLGWTLIAWVIAMNLALTARPGYDPKRRRDDDTDPESHLAFPRDVEDALDDLRDDD